MVNWDQQTIMAKIWFNNNIHVKEQLSRYIPKSIKSIIVVQDRNQYNTWVLTEEGLINRVTRETIFNESLINFVVCAIQIYGTKNHKLCFNILDLPYNTWFLDFNRTSYEGMKLVIPVHVPNGTLGTKILLNLSTRWIF